jgi:tryptophan-rich sensory protein
VKVGIARVGWLVGGVLVANWLFNQAYSYIQFTRKQWLPAAFDSALIALTAFAYVVIVWETSPLSAWLFVPYALWACFATYLSYAIWALNR